MIYPPLDSKLVVPDMPLWDDRGAALRLKEVLKRQDVNLLLPGFTTCHGACPQLARLYKALIEQSGLQKDLHQRVQVVFLSFDPNDTTEDLAAFRAHASLPDDWIVVRSEPNATTQLLADLNYTVMNLNGIYQHPAQAFVFTRELHWVGSLYGADVNTAELLQIVQQARYQQSHPYLAQAYSIIKSPNTLAVGAGGGLLFGIGVLMWLSVRLTRK